MKKIHLLLISILFMFVLAACGANSNSDAEKDNASSGEKEETKQAETVTVKHQLDETEVKKNPEKVVVFDFGTLDTLDQLGVDVIGLPKTNVPNYLSKYEDDKYENIGSLKEPDFEKINSLKPDLIIISGRQSDLYEQFKEIAPTIFMGVDTSNYMESFTSNVNTLAEIFGKEAEAEKELASLQERIDALHEKASSLDEKALIVLANEGKASAYGPSSRFGIIHDVFGFAPADEKIEVSTHGQSVTFEYFAEVNPDYLFVIDRGAAIGGESGVKELMENDLVKKTNAYKNDHIIYLNAETWYLSGGGLISVSKMVEEIEATVK